MKLFVALGVVATTAAQQFIPNQTLPDFKWPQWPFESEVIGTSIGPFPFWCDTANKTKGAFKFTCINRDHKTHHRTRMIYSYSRMSQITFRDNCDLTHFGGEKGVQCAHRFTPDGKAFVTYGDRDDGYCCQSFGHLPQCNPLPIPHPSFMNTCLKRVGPVPYEGPYFKGMIYNYTDEFAELPTYFWYFTVAEPNATKDMPVGYPIEQGEGCVIDYARADECTNKGSVSRLGPTYGDPPFQAFTYERFEETVFDDVEFDLPKSCTGDKLRECYNMECGDPVPPMSSTGMRALDPTFRGFFGKH